MATTIILLGSILGFLGAVLAFTVFQAGLLVALAIWALSGPFLACVMLVLMVQPDPDTVGDHRRTEAA